MDLKFITLTIPARRLRSERVRVLSGRPSIVGRVVGQADGRIICSIAIADVRRYLIGNLSAIEGHALRLAEAGEHDEASTWLAQYVAIRDRISAGGMWRSRV
jgi:hypothetical protein